MQFMSESLDTPSTTVSPCVCTGDRNLRVVCCEDKAATEPVLDDCDDCRAQAQHCPWQEFFAFDIPSLHLTESLQPKMSITLALLTF